MGASRCDLILGLRFDNWRQYAAAEKAYMLEGHDLNHFIVIEGDPPQATLDVLHSWLAQRLARSLSERVWVYRARVGDDLLHVQRKELSRQLRAGAPAPNQAPFLIHFLAPNGTGVFSYKLPASASADDDEFGSIGAGS